MFTVNDVRSYRKHGSSRNAVAVREIALDFAHKRFQKPYGYIVSPVVVVAVFGEVAFYFKVYDYAFTVADRINFCIFNSRKRINRAGKSRYTRSEKSSDFRIVRAISRAS